MALIAWNGGTYNVEYSEVTANRNISINVMRPALKKSGAEFCKDAHRRIGIYRGFVDKYFEELGENYIFKGGEGVEPQDLIELYQKGKKYNAVLIPF